MRQLRRSLRSSLTKNAPEIQALVTGNMPSFVIRASRRMTGVPVFFFHDVEPGRFEAQLRYLGANGYRTLDADQLEARLRRPQDQGRDDGRDVALTFDDATWTFWAYAFPLLRRHGARAILFAIPGIVPDDPAPYPNLEDLWAGRCSAADIAARAKVQPLCTWRELQALHASGVVDIQSHSLTHALVPVSARIDDFVHPGFAAGTFANSDLPLASSDDPRQPARRLRLGAPVFEAASRLCGRPRFLEAPELAQALVDHVAARGGAAFFERPSWRRELATLVGRLADRPARPSRDAGADARGDPRRAGPLEGAARAAPARQGGPALLLSLVRRLRSRRPARGRGGLSHRPWRHRRAQPARHGDALACAARFGRISVPVAG